MPEFTFNTDGLDTVEFKAGDTIIREGKPTKEVYVLKSGDVRVESNGELICKVNEPLTILGEMSVLLDSEATATVLAESDSTFYVIPDLLEYGKENPESTMHVARTIAARLVNMNNLFIEVKAEMAKQQGAEIGERTLSSRLHALMVKMDNFWGQDVLTLNKKS